MASAQGSPPDQEHMAPDVEEAFEDLFDASLASLAGDGPPAQSERELDLARSPFGYVARAMANAYDLTFGAAPTAPRDKPVHIVDRGPQRLVRRYEARYGAAREPMFLVPPLGGPVDCFDLHPASSVIENLTWADHPTYVLDYGPIRRPEGKLGLEHWVLDVVPTAIRAAAEDAGEPVNVAGWCLGGIFSLLALAADPSLPVRTLSVVASPIDFEQVPLFRPIREAANLTGTQVLGSVAARIGAIPAPLVAAGFRLTAIDRYLTRPIFLAKNIANREALIHMRAVDRYMARMHAYPGATMAQLYDDFFWGGQLAGGRVELGDRAVELSSIAVPVLAVAGESDVLAPPDSVLALGPLLTGSPDVRMKTAPGGHLGVLSGMGASNTTWAFVDELVRDASAAAA